MKMKTKWLLIVSLGWKLLIAPTLAVLPLLSLVLAYHYNELWLVLLSPITPLFFYLVAKKTDYVTTHIDQKPIQRYVLPKWLFWASTADEHLPGGMYEPMVLRIYNAVGWVWCSIYWTLLRNAGSAITWHHGHFLGAIYADGIYNTDEEVTNKAQQVLADHLLHTERFLWIFQVHWEVSKDFYGTFVGRADENWRTCDYIAKPSIRLSL